MHSRREPGFKSHFILSEGDTTSIFLSVESLAISHYQKTEGWSHAVHAEGATFSTLFGILFWNVVFGVEVPDVFRNAFQVSIAHQHIASIFVCVYFDTASYIQPVWTLHTIRNTHTTHTQREAYGSHA